MTNQTVRFWSPQFLATYPSHSGPCGIFFVVKLPLWSCSNLPGARMMGRGSWDPGEICVARLELWVGDDDGLSVRWLALLYSNTGHDYDRNPLVLVVFGLSWLNAQVLFKGRGPVEVCCVIHFWYLLVILPNSVKPRMMSGSQWCLGISEGDYIHCEARNLMWGACLWAPRVAMPLCSCGIFQGKARDDNMHRYTFIRTYYIRSRCVFACSAEA